LRREIIATTVTNSIINRAGSHFVFDMAERTGNAPDEIVRAYLLARTAFDLRAAWTEIEMLDNKVPAGVQTGMLLAINETLDHATQWFLVNAELHARLAAATETCREGIRHLANWLETRPPEINGRCKKTESQLATQGVPAPLARRVAYMPLLKTALDLTQLAAQTGHSMDKVAEIFFGLGQRLGIDWLAERAHAFVADTPWQREAVAAILDDLAISQRGLTALVISKGDKGKKARVGPNLADWLAHNAGRIEHHNALLSEWRSVGAVDVAMLTLASRQLAALLS